MAFFPKNERHQEREAGMGREKQVTRKGERIHDSRVHVEGDLRGGGADVRQDDKKGPHGNKQAQAF